MTRILILVSLLSFFAISINAESRPERAILFIIDGLHIDAPERLNMSHFTDLAKQGTLINNTTVIMPGHPRVGEYARIHTSSFPNPVTMAGTLFMTPDQTMLQHRFSNAAFVANSLSYQSITDGYTFVIQKSGPDEFSIDKSIELLAKNDIDFMRIHLQNVGSAGNRSTTTDENQPYRHNIWHEESPFVQSVRESDRQLGRFITALKDLNLWEGTLLIVTSDHGQTDSGWHPLIPQESWLHPTIFYGPGVKEGHIIEWADQTDLAPTIARLMNVPAPNDDGGSGRVLKDVMQSETAGQEPSSSKILELNRIFVRYMLADAELILKSVDAPYLNTYTMRMENRFYGLERILEWKDLGTIDDLIRHNLELVIEMEQTLEEFKQ